MKCLEHYSPPIGMVGQPHMEPRVVAPLLEYLEVAQAIPGDHLTTPGSLVCGQPPQWVVSHPLVFNFYFFFKSFLPFFSLVILIGFQLKYMSCY
jgi:hypothetical protein